MAYVSRYQYRTPFVPVPVQKKTGLSIVLSGQQIAIKEAIRERFNHVFVIARAGSGKSTTLALSVEGLQNVVIITFGKENTKDLQEKGAPALTSHSLGLQAIRRAYSWYNQNCLNKNKTTLLSKKYLEEDEEYLASAIKQLVSLCKANLLGTFTKESDSGNWILQEGTLSDEELSNLTDRHDVDLNESADRVFKIVRMILVDSLNCYIIDYDDMIWWTVVKNLPVTRYNLLGVDEAQDINRAQQHLALMAIRGGGRLVVVGDPHQSMYSWRGALLESMDKFRELISSQNDGKEIEHLPLTKSRRCCKAAIRLAQKSVPDIEYMEDAPEGLIESITTQKMVEIVSAGDMILSRTRAPLIKQAYSFLREEKKTLILGTDIGSHLESFIKKFNAADVQSLRKKLDEYEEKQTERLSGNKSSIMQLSLLKDRCECVRILMHNCDKISEVITKVHRLFVDEDDKTQRAGAIILATVHKAKGLEAKNVFVIEPSKIPHPLAKRQHQIEEESHIAYVAVTRAKETIRFVGPIPSIFGDGFVAPVPEPEPVYNPPVVKVVKVKKEGKKEFEPEPEPFADESMLKQIHSMKLCSIAKEFIPNGSTVTISAVADAMTKISKHLRKCRECGK